MLVPVKIELFQLSPHPQRILIGAVGAPGVEHEHHIVAHLGPNRSTCLQVLLDMRGAPRIALFGDRIVEIIGMYLVGTVALALALGGVFSIVLGPAHVGEGAGVGFDLVPTAPQELVHRHTEHARL